MFDQIFDLIHFLLIDVWLILSTCQLVLDYSMPTVVGWLVGFTAYKLFSGHLMQNQDILIIQFSINMIFYT